MFSLLMRGVVLTSVLFCLDSFQPRVRAQLPCSAPVFRTGTAFITDLWPGKIAKGDINNDAKLDVISVSRETGALSALLGRGDGTFEDRRDSIGHGRGTGITLGDADLDGKLDAVVISASGPEQRATLYRGDGTGNFSPLFYITGYNPQDVRLVHLDSDGILDLVVVWGDSTVGKLAVYRGKGAGGFGPATEYDLAKGVGNRLAVADFNGDGRTDIAFSSSGFIDVWLGDGSGGLFRSGWSSQNYGGSLYAGELGFGSAVDLILVDNTFNKVYLFSGNGDGGFSSRGNFDVGDGPRDAVITDVNQDGKNDIVTANHVSNEISVLLSKDEGVFSKAVHYSTSEAVGSLLIDDFDSDGKPDAVTSGYRLNQPDSQIRVTRGLGDGRFSAPVRHEVYQYSYPNTVAVGDLNDDGQEDVVVGNSGQADMFTAGVSIFLRNGDFRLGERRDHLVGAYVNRVEIEDVDLDGDADIIAVGEKYAQILIGDGRGNFTSLPRMTINPQGGDIWAISLVVGRYDGDKLPDILLGDRMGSVYIARGLGGGAFQSFAHAFRDYNLPFVRDMVAADVNDDGNLDLAIITDAGFDVWAKLRILLNNGNGEFFEGEVHEIGWSLHPGAIIVGDLDGDAINDLAVTVDYNAGIPSYVQVYKGLGGGRYSAAANRINMPDLQPTDMIAADLNSDGILDLAVTNDLAENVVYLEGQGNLTYRLVQKTFVGDQAKRMALGHLNNDTSPDIVVVNTRADSFSVIQNTCNSAPDPRLVSISGRVTAPNGLGLRNVFITLTDGIDPPRRATTSSLGYYTFSNVLTTRVYQASANSKRYRFASQSVSLHDLLSNLDFIGLE